MAALAKGLIVRRVKDAAGKWVLQFWKAGAKGVLKEASEAEVKALAQHVEKQLLNPSGFKNFGALKRELGPAGEGNVWHHIVEQRPVNVQQFGAEAIHNTSTAIAISRDANQAIANYYASKQLFTNGLSVRNWLRTQSFAQQRAFGLEITKRVLSGVPLP